MVCMVFLHGYATMLLFLLFVCVHVRTCSKTIPQEEVITLVQSNIKCFSRMFVNRVPHMLDADYTPYSAVNIFVKDLVRKVSLFKFLISLSNELILFHFCSKTNFLQGIVLSQGKSRGVHLHLAATAHQQFLLGHFCDCQPVHCIA